jgi:hypothetical protein
LFILHLKNKSGADMGEKNLLTDSEMESELYNKFANIFKEFNSITDHIKISELIGTFDLKPDVLALSILDFISVCPDESTSNSACFWFYRSATSGYFGPPTSNLVDKIFYTLENHKHSNSRTDYRLLEVLFHFMYKHRFDLFTFLKVYFFKGFKIRQICIILLKPALDLVDTKAAKKYFNIFGGLLIQHLEESRKEEFSKLKGNEIKVLENIVTLISFSYSIGSFLEIFSPHYEKVHHILFEKLDTLRQVDPMRYANIESTLFKFQATILDSATDHEFFSRYLFGYARKFLFRAFEYFTNKEMFKFLDFDPCILPNIYKFIANSLKYLYLWREEETFSNIVPNNLSASEIAKLKIKSYDSFLVKSVVQQFLSTDYSHSHHLEEKHFMGLLPLESLIAICFEEQNEYEKLSPLGNSSMSLLRDIRVYRSKIISFCVSANWISPTKLFEDLNNLLEETKGNEEKSHNQQRALFIFGSLMTCSSVSKFKEYFKISRLLQYTRGDYDDNVHRTAIWASSMFSQAVNTKSFEEHDLKVLLESALDNDIVLSFLSFRLLFLLERKFYLIQASILNDLSTILQQIKKVILGYFFWPSSLILIEFIHSLFTQFPKEMQSSFKDVIACMEDICNHLIEDLTKNKDEDDSMSFFACDFISLSFGLLDIYLGNWKVLESYFSFFFSLYLVGKYSIFQPDIDPLLEKFPNFEVHSLTYISQNQKFTKEAIDFLNKVFAKKHSRYPPEKLLEFQKIIHTLDDSLKKKIILV